MMNKALAAPQLTTATELSELGIAGLAAHWQAQVQQGHFLSHDDLSLPYAKLVNAQHQKTIIVVNGRTESYLKYQELALDLFNNGYNVYLYDHRGQGLAPRLLANPDVGYVADFDDYVQDLEQFVQQVVLKDPAKPLYLVSHSMGGTVAALWLSQTQVRLQAAALSSPMMSIYVQPLPLWLAKGLISVLNKSCQWLGHTACYAPGQGDYQALPFKDNVLTHSEVRYQLFIDQYQLTPEVQLGGVSSHWLQQAFNAGEQAIAQAGRITTPILVLQAGQDVVVDNKAQDRFCQALPACEGGRPKRIKKAAHEIFLEQDNERRQALTAILSFFAQHPPPARSEQP
ncbi:alpha/beta fold hydrolase [Oceanisphaera sp. IT1-181]|uniref:alpha/beta fold hydrolase n=1 Tax=Oceanisphaera sp. IT1-181 TaxID=3081199 RepID=UPI0029CA5ECB|nr:alpha/beta fold hydrolase [Oceanisphaera sp. IT1-181]